MRRLSQPGVAFLDRDGTINVKAPEGDYITRPDLLHLLPGAARAIRRLNDAKVTVIVVTNQRGIALGRMDEDDLDAVHARLCTELEAAAGARIDAFFHCPHAHDSCDCRKPDVGMFLQAREQFPWIVFERSAIVGDSVSDVEAGRRLGLSTLQLGVEVVDLDDAVERLLGEDA